MQKILRIERKKLFNNQGDGKMEALKFSIIIIFLSILIFLMGLFITKSISHSIFLIYFILSFLLPMLII